jgi:acetyl-CoA carboxylase biotin carboxyl carrier protein
VAADELNLIARVDDDGTTLLVSPAVGILVGAPRPGTMVAPGTIFASLEILGRHHRLIVPAGASGVVRPAAAGPRLAHQPVGHGDVIARLVAATAVDAAASPAATAATAGLVFRSPSSGRFYCKPGPDKPPFVSAGDEIATGHTVCLLEVMKTFSRIGYGGDGLPPRVRVVRVVPTDGADVDADDVLLELAAI